MLNIVCWKWEPKDDIFRKRGTYSHVHVNKLYNMLSRNLRIPFRLICITDNPIGINKEIKIIPLWKDYREYGMCWTRLKIFSNEMKTLIGDRILSMDLDCVILQDITSLVDNNYPFIMWEKERMYCGSIFMFTAGTKANIWSSFTKQDLFKHGNGKWLHKKAFTRGFKNTSDQSYISYLLYPNEKSWTKKDGVYNFDTQIYNKNVNMSNVKIVFFNGKKDPSQKILYREYPWIEQNWR